MVRKAIKLKSSNGKSSLEQALAAQERAIRELRLIIANEQALSESEQAVVVFDDDTRVIRASRLFCSLTGIRAEDIPLKNYNVLDFITSANMEIVDGTQDALGGKTRFVKNLVTPLKMFLPEWNDKRISAYTKAMFFPLSETDGKYGAAVFMK